MRNGGITAMKISSLGYCIKQGFKNIYRNRLFSLASVATMAACIFLFGIFFCVAKNVSYMVTEVEKNTCLTVFFDVGTSDARIESIGKTIQQMENVTLIEYTSPEEAWEKYKVKYFGDRMDLADGFEEDNPLANSASYTVYLDSADALATVVASVENIDGVRSVKRSEITANSLTDVSGLVSMISLTMIVVLFLVALFLIGNTVSVGIAVRKEEIAIMKLIGAKNSFVRAPFIVEGIVIGFVGAMLPMIVIYYLYENVVYYIINRFTFLSNILAFLPVRNVFATLVPIAAILGIGIGFLGSYTTLRKHLKV